MAFDSTGTVYVADLYNYRIQVFTAEGEFVRKFGQGKGIHSPAGISIDCGNEPAVYVTESNYNRISVFTCEGKFLTSFGSGGSGPGQFIVPFGIAIDRDGVVYVSDICNNRLQLF